MAERKRCKLFDQPLGCHFGQRCRFLHAQGEERRDARVFKDNAGQDNTQDNAQGRARGGSRDKAAKDAGQDNAAQGVRISTYKATAAQEQAFAQLKPGLVAGWLRRTFKLPDQRLEVRRAESTLQVALEASVAASLLGKAHNLRLEGIPVRFAAWRGSGRPAPASRDPRQQQQQQQQQQRSQKEQQRQQAPPTQDTARNGPPDASDDVTKFWRRLEVAVEADRKASGKERLNLHEPASRAHWLACWAVAAAGAPGSCEVLLRVLLNAPSQADIAPQAADVVQVLSRIVASLETRGERQQLQALSTLELVVDAVATRLCGHEARVADVDAVIGYMQLLLECFMAKVGGVMSGAGSEGRLRAGKLMGRCTTIMPKYSDALYRARNAPTLDAPSADDERTLSPWLAWQQPTVGWLMSDASSQSWLRPSLAFEPTVP